MMRIRGRNRGSVRTMELGHRSRLLPAVVVVSMIHRDPVFHHFMHRIILRLRMRFGKGFMGTH